MALAVLQGYWSGVARHRVALMRSTLPAAFELGPAVVGLSKRTSALTAAAIGRRPGGKPNFLLRLLYIVLAAIAFLWRGSLPP